MIDLESSKIEGGNAAQTAETPVEDNGSEQKVKPLSIFFDKGFTKRILVGLSDIDTNNYAKVLDYKDSLNREPSLQKKGTSGKPIQTPNSQERIVNKLHQQQKRLSDEEIDQIIAGYKSGQPMLELAMQFGCHRTTISNNLKKHGVMS